VGAGDHLDKVDTRIRRLKELMRLVIADLPYHLPKDRVKDLVTYAVARLNIRSTKALNGEKSPRVRLTGFRPDFKQEFGLAFGDYAEAFDPKAGEKSNDVTVPRTEPCIALYPSANKNGSWVFFNLKTKTYVGRTQWTKLPTNKLVILVMNELAGANGIKLADLGVEPEPEREAQDCNHAVTVQVHEPIRAEREMTNEEAKISLEEIQLDDVPDLVDRGDDDSVSESGDDDDDLRQTDSDSDPNDDERFEEEIDEMDRWGEELETDDTGSLAPHDMGTVQV
jgi:hypothetical protein